jgi:hypothetical protein
MPENFPAKIKANAEISAFAFILNKPNKLRSVGSGSASVGVASVGIASVCSSGSGVTHIGSGITHIGSGSSGVGSGCAHIGSSGAHVCSGGTRIRRHVGVSVSVGVASVVIAAVAGISQRSQS